MASDGTAVPPPLPTTLVAGTEAVALQEQQRKLGRAFEGWRAKLLDLTARNRALNYKPTKVATLSIVDEKPAEIYRLLVGREQALTFAATLPSKGPDETAAEKPDAEDAADPLAAQTALRLFAPYAREDVASRHQDSVLQCRATPESLDLSLRRIADLQRASIEEQGVNTIFLALGFLHYREAQAAKETSRAPLVLVPVTLERSNAKAGFRLLLAEDEPIVNPSLVEYLRRFHSFQGLPSIPEPNGTDESVDLLPFYSAVAEQVRHLEGWCVTEEVVLAPFTFQKLVIYKDIEQNQESFSKHPLVRRVVLKEGEPQHDLPPGFREAVLDEQYPPELTHQVVDADSSQLRAIAAAAAGHDLVIHGPPGTGKSQTITNLIAEALGAGKRVLFVSEKMAALDVVHRRLVAARLGEFCLELHSTKARKADVIESLKAALEKSASSTAGTVTSAVELARARKHLNTYTSEVHVKRTQLDCSTFEAVGLFARAYDAPRFTYPADPTSLKRVELEALEDGLRQLGIVGASAEPVRSHGLRDSRLRRFSSSMAEKAESATDDLLKETGRFLEQAAALRERFGVREPKTVSSVPALVDLADHINKAPGLPGAVLRDSKWSVVPTEVQQVLETGRRVSALRTRLKERYRREQLDTVSAADLNYLDERLGSPFSFVAFLAPRYRDIRRRLSAMRLKKKTPRLMEQLEDLKALPKFKSDTEALNSHQSAPLWFGAAWRGAGSDWADLEARLAWLVRFHSMVSEHGPLADAGYAVAERGGPTDSLPEELRATTRSLAAALTPFREALAFPSDYLQDASVEATRSRAADVLRDLPRGADWVAFVHAVERLAGGPAAAIAEAALRGDIAPAQAGPAFRRSLYGSWLDSVLPSIASLAGFTTHLHEDNRKRFQQLDSKLLTEKQGELVSRLRENAQRKYGSCPAAHRTFLSKELAKQKRHRPLRVTLREAHSAVAALKPCYLMSPLSVSQYLGPTPDFDLVVFDEASQLPTEDAVTAICRGKQLVVVGDPKQLPPTNFFSIQAGNAPAATDGDGGPVVEDTESVLEEFQGVGLHQAHLEWHYRSAHESLIQFSNEKFYGNNLVVFPSAASETPTRGVKFRLVEGGRYEGAGLNPVEARHIAVAVVAHFRSSPEQSLGVGTFSQRQQMAVWDELERIRREDPSLEEFFDRSRREPFFVKNLENIQGDERDVIFLSVTYGRQADGKLRYNFGPLNRENGWRRLNVLVSRARQMMVVFSSLKAADINPTTVASQGPALLADFLRFAETGKLMVDSSSTEAEADSPFEAEVGRALEDMGYLVARQVGVGAYRIDIGVKHRDRPGVFLAGVECDGAAYHAAPCARDRDRLRQYVLEERGWTILRVWSTDWFRNRAGVLERLKRSLGDISEHALEGAASERQPSPSEDDSANESAEAPPFTLTMPTAPHEQHESGAGVRWPAYRRASPTRTYRTSLTDASGSHVADEVAHIVSVEGPVHNDEVVTRLLEFWNHERRGARLVMAAQHGIHLALNKGAIRIEEGFLLAPGRPVEVRNRVGLDLGADAVSFLELALASRSLLAQQGAIQEADLATAVRDGLGLRRTAEGLSRIRQAIQNLVEDGEAIHGVAGLRLRSIE